MKSIKNYLGINQKYIIRYVGLIWPEIVYGPFVAEDDEILGHLARYLAYTKDNKDTFSLLEIGATPKISLFSQTELEEAREIASGLREKDCFVCSHWNKKRSYCSLDRRCHNLESEIHDWAFWPVVFNKMLVAARGIIPEDGPEYSMNDLWIDLSQLKEVEDRFLWLLRPLGTWLFTSKTPNVVSAVTNTFRLGSVIAFEGRLKEGTLKPISKDRALEIARELMITKDSEESEKPSEFSDGNTDCLMYRVASGC